MKLNFKQYYESKMKLLEAVNTSPKIKLKYSLTKYCKIPFYETIDSSDKKYLTLKPDDIVEILWEYDTPDHPTAKCMWLLGEPNTLFPSWNSTKIFNWSLSNTTEI
jgi:hypothetical protein